MRKKIVYDHLNITDDTHDDPDWTGGIEQHFFRNETGGRVSSGGRRKKKVMQAKE